MPVTSGMFKVVYQEFVENYRETYRPDGNESVRILQCAWDQRHEFVADLIGYPILNGTTIERRLPEQHPELLHLYAVECDLVAGLGVPDEDPNTSLIRFLNVAPGPGNTAGDDEDPSTDEGEEPDDDSTEEEADENLDMEASDQPYGKARYAVTYRALPYAVLSDEDVTTELDRFVERRQTFAAESLNRPGVNFRYFGDPGTSSLQQDVPLIQFTKEISMTWFQVPKIPEKNIRLAIGTVNSSTFDAGGYTNPDGTALGFPASTLLMIAPDVRRMRNAVGDILYEITYKFLYNPNTWTALFRNSTGQYETILFRLGPNAGANAPYLGSDFAKLFQLT